MKKNVLLLFIFLANFPINAQNKAKGKIDTDGYWVGYANKATFDQENYSDWFYDYYDRYRTDKEIIEQLKSVTKGVQIKAYMATWCWESKRDIPRLYKILEEIGYDFNDLELISVDRSRKVPVGKEKNKKLNNVPELIFIKNGKELGRLTKYPMGNIEKYILKTIIGEPFQKQPNVKVNRS